MGCGLRGGRKVGEKGICDFQQQCGNQAKKKAQHLAAPGEAKELRNDAVDGAGSVRRLRRHARRRLLVRNVGEVKELAHIGLRSIARCQAG